MRTSKPRAERYPWPDGVPQEHAEVIIVGGGIAGLSAAIYLGRAERDVLVVDSGNSMVRWEKEVENYLGFVSVPGRTLLSRAKRQASHYGARFAKDFITHAKRAGSGFKLLGKQRVYCARRVLLATGIFHLPPEIEGVEECLGKSMFFCKDCDGYRVRGLRIGVYGTNNEVVEYALGMLFYSRHVAVLTDGGRPGWDAAHAKWLQEYDIPVHGKKITRVRRRASRLRGVGFAGGGGMELDALFTTRGDVCHNTVADALGAKLDREGQVIVDSCQRASVPGLYAAGCVTPANCQIIIAAGQGAAAAQAINRDLFQESLATHSLRKYRMTQLRLAKNSRRKTSRRNLLSHTRTLQPSASGQIKSILKRT